MNSSNPRFIHEHSIGHVVETSEITGFFGGRRSSKEAIASAFPDYDFKFMKQIHSDQVLVWPFVNALPAGTWPEGDALITREHKIALCVRTADCVPVLIHDHETDCIAAIHAGWRGVASEIIRKTGLKMLSLTAGMSDRSRESKSLNGARAWIGPHIGVSSFEVGLDVAQKLEASFESVRGYTDAPGALHEHPDPNKKYVNLLTIVRAQLRSIGIEDDCTSTVEIDTYMSDGHESFRRDRSSEGRQISFIALK